MPNPRPFNQVILQWLQLLVRDPNISPQACRIATYIAVVRFNDERGKAWPSHERVAEDLSIDVKTVQRSIKNLDDKWFNITRGRGPGRSTVYVPSKSSQLAASELREANEVKNKDKIVRFPKIKTGQKCRSNQTFLSRNTGQKCPPKESTERIQERGFHDALAIEMLRHAEGRWVHIRDSSPFRESWDDRLSRRNLPSLQELFCHERDGFVVPTQWPCPPGDEGEYSQVAALVALSGKDHLLKRITDAS